MDIFVFGSNLGGVHGAGSARAAREHHGACPGVGVGRQGSSYAIPTKDHHLAVLPIESIRPYVKDFLRYAWENPELTFNVVAIGCGLAGYGAGQMAPLFDGAPVNVKLPQEFLTWLTSQSV